jgi:hypothetical protein
MEAGLENGLRTILTRIIRENFEKRNRTVPLRLARKANMLFINRSGQKVNISYAKE